MSLTPFGTDIWRNGDISFEIPSKEVIHAHAASGVTETSVSKESDFCMLSPMPLTPAARAALQWRRSRNEKVVAVPALVRFHLTFSCILPTASRLQRTALTTSTLHQCRWNIESVSHLEQIEACESRARKQ